MHRLVRRPGLAAILAGLALCTWPDAASAQPRGPRTPANDPKLAEAKRRFDEGAELYGKGSYEQAIAAWERSYELSKRPLIFESIANAYERLGQARKARESLAKWREAAPPNEHAVLDERLKNLDERIAREDAIKKKQDEEQAAGEAKRRKEQEARAAQEREAQSAPSFPGLVLVGAGSGAIAVGVTLGVVAAAGRPDASTACQPAGERQVCSESARDDIESSASLAVAGDVLWIAGAAAAGVGATLILLNELGKPAAATTGMIAPIVTPSSGGLSIRYRF